jgi:hypothetical protein
MPSVWRIGPPETATTGVGGRLQSRDSSRARFLFSSVWVMTILKENVDRFAVHPAYAMAALLPDREHVDRLIKTLSGGIDAGPVVEVFHGQAGLQILDRRGAGHGLSAWFRRLLQNSAYYDQILGLYGASLIGGDFLTVVPCGSGERREIAAAAISHEGHSLYYFGFDTVELVLGN